MMEFKAWPKTPRLFRDITVTEKIDGTNAAVIVTEDGEVGAQSRNRLITPGKDTDNAGFAGWVEEHADSLLQLLGVGYHYGEWWGKGIQRGYGQDGKRFSLFNTHRYAHIPEAVEGTATLKDSLGLVPVLYQGPYSQIAIEDARDGLAYFGSSAAPGFMQPEGIVVHHSASGQVYKVLIENDHLPKGLAA